MWQHRDFCAKNVDREWNTSTFLSIKHKFPIFMPEDEWEFIAKPEPSWSTFEGLDILAYVIKAVGLQFIVYTYKNLDKKKYFRKLFLETCVEYSFLFCVSKYFFKSILSCIFKILWHYLIFYFQISLENYFAQHCLTLT